MFESNRSKEKKFTIAITRFFLLILYIPFHPFALLCVTRCASFSTLSRPQIIRVRCAIGVHVRHLLPCLAELPFGFGGNRVIRLFLVQQNAVQRLSHVIRRDSEFIHPVHCFLHVVLLQRRNDFLIQHFTDVQDQILLSRRALRQEVRRQSREELLVLSLLRQISEKGGESRHHERSGSERTGSQNRRAERRKQTPIL